MITSRFLIGAMLVFGLHKKFDTRCDGTFTIYVRTEFHAPTSDGTLVNGKPSAKENERLRIQ